MIRFFLLFIFVLCFSSACCLEGDVVEERLHSFYEKGLLQVTKPKCFKDEDLFLEELPKMLVFVSFSMPDSLWKSLSDELEKVEGVFILQGLPNNSFKDLAYRIYQLREKGVQADIQLHPKLFDEYEIKHVPTIVMRGEGAYDKLNGAVSIEFALKQFQLKGNRELASQLLEMLNSCKN